MCQWMRENTCVSAVLVSLHADLARLQDAAGFSGIARISRGDDILFEQGYGEADRAAGVPVTAGTRFGIASVTKMFTAVAIVDLAARGLLTTDSPVVDVLPPERRPRTLRADVTIAHLLSHTSGIADYAEEEGEQELDYAGLWRERPSYRMENCIDFLPLYADLPPHRPPGSQFQYSNAGYLLLGLIIEEVTGSSYREYIDEAVFARAGMASSGFFRLDESRPQVAVGYLTPGNASLPWPTNVFSIPAVGTADGGAFATASDIDAFLRAFHSGALVGEQLRNAMLTPRASVRDGLAMGWSVYVFDRPADVAYRFGHGGSDPGAEAIVLHLPALDASIITLANMNGVVATVRDHLLDALLRMS